MLPSLNFQDFTIYDLITENKDGRMIGILPHTTSWLSV